MADFEYFEVSPVFVANDPSEKWKRIYEGTSLLIGRDFLPGELGCLLAHKNARARMTRDWILVLEDDADISMVDLTSIDSVIENLDPATPTIVSLSSAKDAIGKQWNLNLLRYRPSLTVAYLASHSVREIDSEPDAVIGVADWPLSFVRAKFYELEGVTVTSTQSDSVIDPGHLRATSASRYYSSALANSRKVLQLFGFKGLQYSLLSPILRDLSRRLK